MDIVDIVDTVDTVHTATAVVIRIESEFETNSLLGRAKCEKMKYKSLKGNCSCSISNCECSSSNKCRASDHTHGTVFGIR